jgi:hypothetical protein
MAGMSFPISWQPSRFGPSEQYTRQCRGEEVACGNRALQGARRIALPVSSVEPATQYRVTVQRERVSLPVRIPGQYLHPRLRRPPLASPWGRAGSSR